MLKVLVVSFTIQNEIHKNSIYYSYSSCRGKIDIVPIGQLLVETPTSLGSDFQDYLVPKTLSMVLGESC